MGFFFCKSLTESRDFVLFFFSEDRRSAAQSPREHLLLPLHLLHPPSSSSAPLEPPEANVDNEHDEKDTSCCQFSVGGAGVQVLGIAPVLL